jgi:hypothetical protein
MLGVADVDLMTAVVCLHIVDIENTHSVWRPSLLIARCDMCFNFASEWCKRVCIEVMVFAPEICIC